MSRLSRSFESALEFLQSIACGTPLSITGTLTSSHRERWFRAVELWIDGAGVLHDRPVALPRARVRRPRSAIAGHRTALAPGSLDHISALATADQRLSPNEHRRDRVP